MVLQDRAYDGAGTKERAARHCGDERASWRDAPRAATMGDDPAWRGEYEKPQPYGTHGQQVGWKRQPLERRQYVVSQHRAPQPGGRPEPAVINESVAAQYRAGTGATDWLWYPVSSCGRMIHHGDAPRRYAQIKLRHPLTLSLRSLTGSVDSWNDVRPD